MRRASFLLCCLPCARAQAYKTCLETSWGVSIVGKPRTPRLVTLCFFSFCKPLLGSCQRSAPNHFRFSLTGINFCSNKLNYYASVYLLTVSSCLGSWAVLSVCGHPVGLNFPRWVPDLQRPGTEPALGKYAVAGEGNKEAPGTTNHPRAHGDDGPQARASPLRLLPWSCPSSQFTSGVK